MGKTMERMKEGYSKIRNEALAHAFAYMNLIEHWGSGIPRIIDKVNMVKDGYLRKEGAARSTIYVKNTEGK